MRTHQTSRLLTPVMTLSYWFSFAGGIFLVACGGAFFLSEQPRLWLAGKLQLSHYIETSDAYFFGGLLLVASIFSFLWSAFSKSLRNFSRSITQRKLYTGAALVELRRLGVLSLILYITEFSIDFITWAAAPKWVLNMGRKELASSYGELNMTALLPRFSGTAFIVLALIFFVLREAVIGHLALNNENQQLQKELDLTV